MGYQEAANIRKKKLSDTIAGRLAEGEGIGSSFTKSISERTKANMTGFKQKVDYLNIAKKLTGGSNLAPALLGRLTGRNSDSIRFFSGKGSAKPVSDKATKIEGGGSEQVEAMQETLDEIYGFLKDTREENEQKKVEAEGKKEEIELEKKRKHDELMKLLGVDTNLPTATKITENPEEDKKSPFESILEKLGWMKYFLMGPVLGLTALLAGIGIGAWLLQKLADNTNNMKAISPEQAENVLKNGYAQDIEDMGGREYLEDIVKNGKKKANDVLSMPDGEEKQKALRDMGGEDKVKAIAADTKEYTVPENIDTGPEKVPPRPDTTGGKNAGRAKIWDNKFAKKYNPDGTKKKATPVSPTQSNDTGNKQVTPEVKTPNSPVPSEPPSAKVSTVTNESKELQIPAPVVDAVKSVNNTVVNSQSTSQVATLPIPSVRNQEPTYQDLVLYSTRVV